VSESNINRQIHALTPTVGMSKVEAMRERIAPINPDCRVTAVDAFVEPGSWPGILPVGVDAVVDACDQLPAKLSMARWARESQTLFVTVGAAGGKRVAHQSGPCRFGGRYPRSIAGQAALPVAPLTRRPRAGQAIRYCVCIQPRACASATRRV